MSDYLVVEINRAYKGNVLDARSYQWERAKALGVGLAFKVLSEDKIYKIDPEQLDYGVHDTQDWNTLYKKAKNKKYHLVLFTKPQPRIDKKEPLQIELFQS